MEVDIASKKMDLQYTLSSQDGLAVVIESDSKEISYRCHGV